MIPLRIDGATRRLAENQEEYHGLSIQDIVYAGYPLMLSSWELDASDLRALKTGKSFGTVLTPISEDGCAIAMARLLNPVETALLQGGGTAVLIVSGTIHPPVNFSLQLKEELESYPMVKLPCTIDFSAKPYPNE